MRGSLRKGPSRRCEEEGKDVLAGDHGGVPRLMLWNSVAIQALLGYDDYIIRCLLQIGLQRGRNPKP